MIEWNCSCEMHRHAAPVDQYFIEENAIEKLVQCVEKYKRIYVVCDETTLPIAGERVMDILRKEKKLFSSVVLPKNPLPDYETIGNIVVHMCDPAHDADIFGFSPLPDFILAVGSGTINDTCRVVSYRFGLEYGVVATAPSMDGYLSAGSPTLFDNTKATIKCTTARFFIGDLNIVKDAPWDMLLAGIGDMFGKYTGILDWELARDYNGDYFCEKIANDVLDATNMCLKNGYALKERNPKSIQNIMNGFVVTGLGMAYTGNSRPASGAEHIVAHAWELEDVQAGKTPNLHGLEVCQATRLIAGMYRMLLAETEDAHLRDLIQKYVGYFDEIEAFCRAFQVPAPIKDPKRMANAVLKALKMRDRYTILFYLNNIGKLEEYAARAAENLAKEL